MEHATFLGLTADGWVAVWTFALFLATVALICVAGYQISEARDEAKKSRTLQACNLYDTDPILDASARRLVEAEAKGELKENPREFRLDICSILNYLEGVAIGIKVGLYDKKIVEVYLGSIIVETVAVYITSGVAARAVPDGSACDPDEFSGTVALANEWGRPNAQTKDLTSLTPCQKLARLVCKTLRLS